MRTLAERHSGRRMMTAGGESRVDRVRLHEGLLALRLRRVPPLGVEREYQPGPVCAVHG